MQPTFMITVQELNAALNHLEAHSPEWHFGQYAAAYQTILNSWISRRLIASMSDQIVASLRLGGDYSVPLILLAATMLESGYQIGRKQAETDLLNRWMKL